MEMATRGSRRVFLPLTESSSVQMMMRSPSRPTHTGAQWGEPSLMMVARWAKLRPSSKRVTVSGSAIAMVVLLTSCRLILSQGKAGFNGATPVAHSNICHFEERSDESLLSYACHSESALAVRNLLLRKPPAAPSFSRSCERAGTFLRSRRDSAFIDFVIPNLL